MRAWSASRWSSRLVQSCVARAVTRRSRAVASTGRDSARSMYAMARCPAADIAIGRATPVLPDRRGANASMGSACMTRA